MAGTARAREGRRVGALPSVDLLPAVPRRHPGRRAAAAAAGVVAGALLLGMLAGWFAGVRVFVVESPSMGRAAPVGTLVVGLPVRGRVAVGDVITYRAPGGAETYTHRVVATGPSGLTTRGDVNGSADPWAVTPSMVVTRAALLIPGAGWLVRAVPILIGGMLVTELLAGLLRRPDLRSAVRQLGVSFSIAAVSLLLRPFTGYQVLQLVPDDGGMRATAVSTALLPIRLIATGGKDLHLVSGQVGDLLLPGGGTGRVSMTAALDLPPLGWVVVGLLSLAPMLAVLLPGRGARDAHRAALPERPPGVETAPAVAAGEMR